MSAAAVPSSPSDSNSANSNDTYSNSSPALSSHSFIVASSSSSPLSSHSIHSRSQFDSSSSSSPISNSSSIHPYRHSFAASPDFSDEDYQFDDTLDTNNNNNRQVDSDLPRPQPAACIPNRPVFSRSLTILTEVASMASDSSLVLDPVPGSPPQLSSSKSSVRTESLQSSPSTDDLNDTSHFEEISLTDSHPGPIMPARTFISKPRPILRTAFTMGATPNANRTAKTPTNMRDMTNDLRTTAALNNHAQKNSPRSGWRSSFLPATTMTPHLTTPTKSGSRTPSPTKTPVSAISPRSSTKSTPRARNENSPILPLYHTQSLQLSRRKTQQELEDEYNDSDDELPDELCMWNIPLSPRPTNSRSPSVSPERGSLQPRTGDRGFRFSRTKTWTAALEELSEDAKKLTLALEQHFDSQEHHKTPASPASSTDSSPRPMLHQRANTVAGSDLQRTNSLADLPVSKEKERYLSRTRPSWLPPKNPKEEAKHLKEFEGMLSSFVGTRKSATTVMVQPPSPGTDLPETPLSV